MRMLLDLRTSNGSYAIDVNQITTDHFSRRLTVLEYSQWAKSGATIENAIRAAGGVKLADLDATAIARARTLRPFAVEELKRVAAIRPAARPVDRKEEEKKQQPQVQRDSKTDAIRQLQQFQQNAQNTHTPEVENSVTESLKRLMAHYDHRDSKKRSNNLDFVRQYLNSLPRTNRKKAIALTGYERICSLPDTHSATGLTLSQILSLIWDGIIDVNARSASQPPHEKKATESIIERRKEALVDKLFEIQTEYNGNAEIGGYKGPSCVGGTRNQLVSVLEYAHPDVTIYRIAADIETSVTEATPSIFKAELVKRSLKEQRMAIKTWHAYENSLDGITTNLQEVEEATSFHEQMKNTIKSGLTTMFGASLVTAPMLDIVTGESSYRYYPWPNPHEELRELIGTIKAMKESKDRPWVTTLKTRAKQVFDIERKSIGEDYTWLLNHNKLAGLFEKLAKCKESTGQLGSIASRAEKINNLEIRIQEATNLDAENIDISIQDLENEISNINQLDALINRKEEGESASCDKILFISKRIKISYDGADFLAALTWLKKHDVYYKKCSQLFQALDEYKNNDTLNVTPSDLKRINKLKECIHALDLDAENIEETIEKLNAEIKRLPKLLEIIKPIEISIQTVENHSSSFDEKINREQTAKKVTGALVETIKSNLDELLEKPYIDESAVTSFVSSSIDNIEASKQTLRIHRGWKDILAHLALTIMTVGTNLLAFGLVKAYRTYQKSPSATFFPVLTETTSIKNINTITTKLLLAKTNYLVGA